LKKILAISSILLFFLLSPFLAFATQYYVSKTDGSNGYNGLYPTYQGGVNGPWLTLSYAMTNGWGADAIVSVCTDGKFRETVTIPSSGTAGHYKTLNTYGTGAKPQILGSTQLTGWTPDTGHYVCTSSLTVALYFINTNGTVKWGHKKASKAACIAEYDWYGNGTNIWCFVPAGGEQDPDSRYISIEGATRDYCISNAKTYITIDGFETAYAVQAGIWFDGTTANYGIIKNCLSHHIGTYPTGYNAGVGDCIRFTASYGLIQSSTLHDGSNHGIYVHEKSGQNCVNNIIEGLHVYDCYHVGIDVLIYFTGRLGSGHIVRYNYVYCTDDWDSVSGVDMGGISLHNQYTASNLDACQVYYNAIWNMMGKGIAVEHNVTNTIIENNTCYKSNPNCGAIYAPGIYVALSATSGTVLKNNVSVDWKDECLFVGARANVSGCDNNCWYQSAGGTAVYTYTDISPNSFHYDDFTLWKSKTGWGTPSGYADAASKWEDPKFVSTTDYHLQASSPCIDTGIAVGLTQDIEGYSVPTGGAPDMGAYEYQGTVEINITDGVNNIADGGTFDFGSRVVASNTDQEFTIQNLGTADLTLSGSPIITITGTNADQFSVQVQPTTPITGGNHVHFTLRFTPTTAGAKVAAISIANNDADENPYDINLTGTGISAAEINVKQNTTNIPDGESYAFGNQRLSTNTDVVFTIENLGGSDLTLSGSPIIILGGADASQFSVQAQPTSPITPGNYTTFTIRFTPTSIGDKTATTTITNNDSDEGTYDLTFFGTGIAPEINIKQGTDNITSGGTYAFGTHAVNTNTDVVFTIENIGTDYLTLSGTPIIVITGSGAAHYSVEAQPTTPVSAPKGSTTFTIRFKPTSTGLKSASISIANDDTDENPYVINFTGTGEADTSSLIFPARTPEVTPAITPEIK